ncbi:MAG: ATP-binding protein [Burkholderiaceae bacterium]
MVLVARRREQALASWTEQAWLVGAFAASALVVTLLLSLRNVRENALRRRTEARLAAEQARALRAYQAAREGAWEWNPRSGETYLSPRMRALLAMPDDAPRTDGPFPLDALHPDDLGPMRALLDADRREPDGPFDGVFRVRRPRGGWRHVRVRGLAIQGDGGVLYCGTAADVSDEVDARETQALLEDQLARARRLEALGTLAGGVAHDFNNILASVLGYAELAREAAAADPAQCRRLDRVLQAGQRGKALVERVLAFSRGAPRDPAPFLLQPIVEEVLQLLETSLPAGVRIERALQAGDAVVLGDATAFYEAVMNLCTNGVQAMQDGGRLRVSLEPHACAQAQLLFEGRLSPGPYARLRIADEGPGIAAGAMAHLFEPFFTTRGAGASGRGTGLGLAVVHRVVTDLRGAIDVASEPGKGACFDLYLPSIAAEPPAVSRDNDPDAIPLGRGQSVLVVDDEPALVELAEEMLASLGYEPFGAGSGAEALSRFEAEPDRFDLILTDEVMPELTGTALARAIHALRPGVPVVLASGWGGVGLEQQAARAGIAVVLGKPLSRAELGRAMERALSASR